MQLSRARAKAAPGTMMLAAARVLLAQRMCSLHSTAASAIKKNRAANN
jgi:hypothetical protein